MLSERLAKALGAEWCPKGCDKRDEEYLHSLPHYADEDGCWDESKFAIDWPIIPVILAALEKEGWYATMRELYGRAWRVEIRGYDQIDQQFAAATDSNLPTALAEAFCAAKEGQK